MNKVKVRCSVCGKPFKTPSLKKTVCPSCEAEAKRAKHHHPEPSHTPAPVTGTASVDVRAALRAAQENQGQFGAYRPPAPTPIPAPVKAPTADRGGQVLTQPSAAHPVKREDKGEVRKPRPAGQPRVRVPHPPREPKPRIQQKPFEPTPEQEEAVRARYLELAQPEFDGIRHQIATELGIPLKAVKEIIKRTREDGQIQSWWERNGGMPSAEDLERIRALYEPLLPEPAIGVHKHIAAQLHLTNTSVYQAIGAIRGQLELPRYLAREGMEPPAASPGEARQFALDASDQPLDRSGGNSENGTPDHPADRDAGNSENGTSDLPASGPSAAE
jgi:hypothetical protein